MRRLPERSTRPDLPSVNDVVVVSEQPWLGMGHIAGMAGPVDDWTRQWCRVLWDLPGDRPASEWFLRSELSRVDVAQHEQGMKT